MGMAAICGPNYLEKTKQKKKKKTVRSPSPRRPHMKFSKDWPSGFRGEVVSKCGRIRRTTTTDNGSFQIYKLKRSCTQIYQISNKLYDILHSM